MGSATREIRHDVNISREAQSKRIISPITVIPDAQKREAVFAKTSPTFGIW